MVEIIDDNLYILIWGNLAVANQ